MPKKSNKKRADGRVAVQVYLGVDENGKRKYKTVYGANQKEADKLATDIKAQIGKGIDVSQSNDTFSLWAGYWILSKENEVSNTQIVLYRSSAAHINRFIGNYSISKIKMADIQNVINRLAICNPNTDKPASTRLLKSIKSTASQVFEYAISNRAIDYNPASFVKIPKSNTPPKHRALTQQEQQWIRETPHRAQTAAMIMLYAGLRRGEVIALTWSDIDFNNHTIEVNKSVEMVNGNPVIKSGGKTKNSNRIVSIPNALISYLKQQKQTTMLVCPNTHGDIMSSSAWNKMWKSYMTDLNLKYGNLFNRNKFDPKGVQMTIQPITAHSLRHTYATLLYFSGIDVLTAKEQLGHASVTTTLNIYTHLDKEFKQNNMKKFDDFLANA